MQGKNIDQSLQSRLNMRLPWKTRLALTGVALLVSLALAAVAVNHLMPKLPGRAQGARISWYLHHGQLQADTRTLAAAVQYILTPAGDTPASFNHANQAVAGSAAPRTPKS